MATGPVTPRYLLRGPGILYTAPVGSALPDQSVSGGLFSAAPWGGSWVPVGSTEAGSQWSETVSTTPFEYAESLTSPWHMVTDREASWQVALAEWNRSNLLSALGARGASISGSGGSRLTTVAPPEAGESVGCMVGWQSQDDSVRFIARECVPAGDLSVGFRPGADNATLSVVWRIQRPSAGGPPYSIFLAADRLDSTAPVGPLSASGAVALSASGSLSVSMQAGFGTSPFGTSPFGGGTASAAGSGTAALSGAGVLSVSGSGPTSGAAYGSGQYGTSTYGAESGAPSAAPIGTRFSTGEDLALLSGPTSAPTGAVVVSPSGSTKLDALTQANPAGTTFYLQAGTHTLPAGQFSQVIPKTGNTYIGAPGAILSGAGSNSYAFTGSAANVTIRYLEITGFRCPFDEFTVNHDCAAGWLIEFCHLHDTWGAAVGIGTDCTVRSCWFNNCRQYAFSSYKPAVDGDNAVKRVVVDKCEMVNCGDIDDEIDPVTGIWTGRGRNGAGKFWDTYDIKVTNNWVHDMPLQGVWADTNNVKFLCEGNYFADIRGQALMYEISYNFMIRNNRFYSCTVRQGLDDGGNYPRAALYISEAGGDSAVDPTYANSEITGNTFIDCWDNISIFENSDRFCNSPANTSGKIWRPIGHGATLGICNNPTPKTLTVSTTAGSASVTVTSGTIEDTDEGRAVTGTGIPAGAAIRWETQANGYVKGFVDPTHFVMTANATATATGVSVTLAGGSINTTGYDACRWRSQNIKVHGNVFENNRARMLAKAGATIGAGVVTGKSAIISNWGTFPAWSPYQGSAIQDSITGAQGNQFYSNTYIGSAGFVWKDTPAVYTLAQWQASPIGQDAGSTIT